MRQVDQHSEWQVGAGDVGLSSKSKRRVCASFTSSKVTLSPWQGNRNQKDLEKMKTEFYSLCDLITIWSALRTFSGGFVWVWRGCLGRAEPSSLCARSAFAASIQHHHHHCHHCYHHRNHHHQWLRNIHHQLPTISKIRKGRTKQFSGLDVYLYKNSLIRWEKT